jgi:hypothetical protein
MLPSPLVERTGGEDGGKGKIIEREWQFLDSLTLMGKRENNEEGENNV